MAPHIGIVGAGRLGASLAVALGRAGFTVSAISNRELPYARRIANELGANVLATTEPREVARASDVVFLTVPDDRVARVAATLAPGEGLWVVHCSGALGLEALRTAADAGAIAGCLHPLQSFPSRAPEPTRFGGIACGIEASAPLSAFLEDAAGRMGASSFRLEGVDRALYHAAAVLVSNHVVALAAAASRLWDLAGLPHGDAREALAPLLAAAAGNVRSRELVEALTGPIARGDAATLERHVQALSADEDLLDLYRRLSAELLRLPLGHDAHTMERLRSVLGAAPSNG